MKRCAVILLLLLALSLPVRGQGVPVVQPNLGQPTLIAPLYFGPNAFQVPWMNDGTVSRDFKAELAGGYATGHLVKGAVDRTGDIYLKLQVPLFTDRVNLSAWWTIREWWDADASVAQARRIDPSLAGKGTDLGPAYLSVDVLAMREKKFRPSIVVRAALRTATEDKAFASARSYDAAGYFFDATVGKNFGPYVRLALSTGFLCWQTDNGRQNDAIMFGALASFSHPKVGALTAQYGGYWGWERNGDFPRTLQLRLEGGPEKWWVRPCVSWQHGFHDWPFDQVRAGVAFTWHGFHKYYGK